MRSTKSVQHEDFLSVRASPSARGVTRYAVLVNSRLTLYESRADSTAMRNMRGELIVLGASPWEPYGTPATATAGQGAGLGGGRRWTV